MYEYELKNMVALLTKKKIIKADQQVQAIAVLKKYWEDKIALVWSTEDVIGRAKDLNGRRISKAKAIDILQSMFHHHDCNYGITWGTIDSELV